ncbi:acetyl-CoA synthetase-like protein [Conidiobolus coronatus NRRL 28638]|uniref:Acetyl-CoA synthetase-like protein n=1 Tax=Conidiobolus coronatus (strain ATCC 28846 / CBS 209.66 / NRRL 28638) TaxID=796925 RepID=A0A137PEJ2_CONC2|nr:acetyl-CoA synthetase-like protein [Conidiobolus coronatus NRRL 28638]|eukprot:KXN73361.1 acetyl-CoA synthetase-like protein [Conidiobolus coronatus NRRL 28638]
MNSNIQEQNSPSMEVEELNEALLNLKKELEEGDITQKGYYKKVDQIMERYHKGVEARKSQVIKETNGHSLPELEPESEPTPEEIPNPPLAFPQHDEYSPSNEAHTPLRIDTSPLPKEKISPMSEPQFPSPSPYFDTPESRDDNSPFEPQAQYDPYPPVNSNYPTISTSNHQRNHSSTLSPASRTSYHSNHQNFNTFRRQTTSQLDLPQGTNRQYPHLRSPSADPGTYRNFQSLPLHGRSISQFDPPTHYGHDNSRRSVLSLRQFDDIPHHVPNSHNYQNRYSPPEHSDSIARRLSESIDRLSIHSNDSSSYYQKSPSVYSNSVPGYSTSKPLPDCPNLIGVLNHMALHAPKALAYTVVDNKGHEASRITWEKLHIQVDKYYQLLHKKITRGERVGLFFRKVETIEFLCALFGCFVAGAVAVPIVATETLSDLDHVIDHSQCRKVITTDANYKSLTKEGRLSQLEWIRNHESTISAHLKRRRFTPFPHSAEMNDLALIEYSKDPLGAIRGVAISHRTIMAQCQAVREYFDTRFSSVVRNNTQESYSPTNPNLPNTTTNGFNPHQTNLLLSIEPRAQVGLVLGGFSSLFCGFHTVFASSALFDSADSYAYTLNRYHANMTILDYNAIKKLIHLNRNAPAPKTTLLEKLQVVMIDCVSPSSMIDKQFVDFFLKKYGAHCPFETLTPVCSLPDHGGMIVSISDIQYNSQDDPELSRLIWLDRNALYTGSVIKASPLDIQEPYVQDPRYCSVISFGSLMPEVTVIIVNPDTFSICSPEMIGEIWVDAPSLSGGYWELPQLSEQVFHAQAFFPDSGDRLEGEYLRTGLAGFLIDQQLVVLGHLHDGIVEKVPYPDSHDSHALYNPTFSYRTHQGSSLGSSALHCHPDITEAVAFDGGFSDIPGLVVAVETPLKHPEQWSQISNQVYQIISSIHGIIPYMIIVSKPEDLPRRLKNGMPIVSAPLCAKFYRAGELPTLHLKVKPEAIQELVSLNHLPLRLPQDPNRVIPQHTGMEMLPQGMDERFGMDIDKFKSITEILAWRAHITPNDLAHVTIDSKGKEIKSWTYSKFYSKISNLAYYLSSKRGLAPGAAVLVIIPHGVEAVSAVHGALAADLTVIPYHDMDPGRLYEEIPALAGLIKDFNIQAILINSPIEDLLRGRRFNETIANSTNYNKLVLPQLINISKIPKTSKKLEGRFDGIGAVLILVYFAANLERQCVKFLPSTLLLQCKLHKCDLNLSPSRPLLVGVRGYNGVGFFHSHLVGIYVGCKTLSLIQTEFSSNPKGWFELIERTQISTVFATRPMVRHAMKALPASNKPATSPGAALQSHPVPGANFVLHGLRAILVPMEGRVDVEFLDSAILALAPYQLDPLSVVPSYETPFNSLISHRAHLDYEPLKLHLHLPSLRVGKVIPVDDPAIYSSKGPVLTLIDSGRVSRDTMIAIVNPVTHTVCQVDEIGEIWVCSDCNADGPGLSREQELYRQFGACIVGGDSSLQYARTGDLGFLHPDQRYDTRPVGEIIATSPLLFVLGGMDQTLNVDGVNHFCQDIETTIEKCHPALIPNSCVTFELDPSQIGIAVEVKPLANNSSDRPSVVDLRLGSTIINAVYDQHGFCPYVIIFLPARSIPRSRLNDKARLLTRDLWKANRLPIIDVLMIGGQK